VTGGEPAGDRGRAGDHRWPPFGEPGWGASAGATVNEAAALDAEPSGTYIAEILAGEARNSPGAMTFSR